MRYLIALCMILFANVATAKETIHVFSKFAVTSPPGRILLDIVQRMNEKDTEYEYRFSSIPGAEGEAAIARAYAEPGKSLLYSTNSEFGMNRDLNAKGYDKGKDFTFIHSFQSVPFSLIVPKKHNIKSVQELVEFVRRKDKAFYVNYASSGPTSVITKRFISKYNFGDNLKGLSYTNLVDIAQSTVTGEYDFFFIDPVSVPTTMYDVIFVTSKQRYPLLPNIPAIGELGLDDLYFETLTFLATTNRNTELARHVETVAAKVCADPNLHDLLNKNQRVARCMGSIELRTKLDNDYLTLR